MLAPHDAVYPKLSKRRLASERLHDAFVFVCGNAVGFEQLRGGATGERSRLQRLSSHFGGNDIFSRRRFCVGREDEVKARAVDHLRSPDAWNSVAKLRTIYPIEPQSRFKLHSFNASFGNGFALMSKFYPWFSQWRRGLKDDGENFCCAFFARRTGSACSAAKLSCLVWNVTVAILSQEWSIRS